MRTVNQLLIKYTSTTLKSIRDKIFRDPSKFWSYVDSKRKTFGFPATMSFNNEFATSIGEISDLFASFFESVYSAENETVTLPSFGLIKSLSVGSISLNYLDVLNALLNVKTNKGSGPDNIPPLLLKKCAHSLVTPLHLIFNQSLSTGVFPDRWKTSHLTPIFKSGSRKDVRNYRGIAILPTIGKLFELLVCQILTKETKHLISSYQHGFMKGRSTYTNLIEFVNFANGVIESGSQVDVIYTDFSKAFDRIRHTHLIAKLAEIGLHSSFLEWITSYLSKRRQYVKIGDSSSKTFFVRSGVPQGSHLGPLLFLLFLNDLADIFKYSRCLLFADDLKVFRSINSNNDASCLQSDLDSLSLWCRDNGLDLNLGKCKIMTFHRSQKSINYSYQLNHTTLQRVAEIRDLGLLFDKKITFSKHIEAITAKAYSMLGFVMRICSEFKNHLALKVLYCALVRSVLEYGSVIWFPNYAVHSIKLERVQKKFLKFMFIKFGWYIYVKFAPYEFKCSLTSLQSLESRRRNACVFFMHDLISGHIDSSNLLSMVNFNVPYRPLRSHPFLRLQQHRTNYGMSEPMNNMSSIVNDISSLIDFNLGRTVFRRRFFDLDPYSRK